MNTYLVNATLTVAAEAGRAEVRRVGSFWYVVGEPYTAYLSLLDALAFGVTP